MDLNKNKRLAIYRQSSEHVQELYGSPEYGKLIASACDKAGLKNVPEREKLTISVGDIILGIYKIDSLPQILKDQIGLTEDKIRTVMISLQPLWDQIPNKDIPTAKPYVFKPEATNPPEIAQSDKKNENKPQQKNKMLEKTDEKITENLKEPLIVTPPQPKQPEPASAIETKPQTEEKGSTYSKVKPLRTFAMDVDMSRAHSYGTTAPNQEQDEDDEPVHSSSQEDLFRK